jgi:hypothetical protein
MFGRRILSHYLKYGHAQENSNVGSPHMKENQVWQD